MSTRTVRHVTDVTFKKEHLLENYRPTPGGLRQSVKTQRDSILSRKYEIITSPLGALQSQNRINKTVPYPFGVSHEYNYSGCHAHPIGATSVISTSRLGVTLAPNTIKS